MQNNTYNPDVLSCLANLSNDEVFTPPALANQMLDMLPMELWSNPDAKFLDPCCKSGVFLREIAKRLIVGLEQAIPDIQERLNHIYKNQLFGIAITELTSLLARRSVYCSKNANSKYSICSDFNTECGNIVFERVQHTWENGRCKFCGATQSEYDRDNTLETHAYQFIHADEVFNMKFDVIIGNPPYQLSDGGAGASATPIFQLFVDQAIKLQPNFLTMIIPAKWYSGGKGLDKFRESMLTSKQLREIHDYKSASDCFGGVEIKGGVMYFLWDKSHKGQTIVHEHIGNNVVSSAQRRLLEQGLDVFIRHNQALPILKKVLNQHPEIAEGKSFAQMVSSRKPFGFPTNFTEFEQKTFENSVQIYANKKIGFIGRTQISTHTEWVDKWKILTARANNIGTEAHDDNLNTIVAAPNTCCTETYLVIGGDNNLNEIQARHIESYLQTKFLRFLVSLRKTTQDAVSKVYSFVPMQDFNEPWDDSKLYKKYGLTADEIAFIESMIQPME